MAGFDFNLPNISNNALSDAKERKQIKEYLYQLTEQLRFTLNNIDSENLGGDMKETYTIIRGLSQNVLGTTNGENNNIALNRFINGTYAEDVDDIVTQIDGKIETYFTDINPNTWAEIDCLKHEGDMWYAPTDKLLKRYDGITNLWDTVEDQKAIDAFENASTAQDTADGKRRVFTTTPYPPYEIGDLWAGGTTSDLMKCKTAKILGQTYLLADWEKAVKYTDDAGLTTFVNGTYATGQAGLQTQIDGKIETYYTSVNPNTWLGIDRAKHNGDMWYDPILKLLKRYDAIENDWDLVEDKTAIDAYDNAADAKDTADGKRRVFVAQPIPPYDVGDLWSDVTGLIIKVCKVAKATGTTYAASDWGLTTRDAAGITTIVDGVVTTDYVNALGISARKMIATNGTEIVTIDGSGQVQFSSVLYGCNVGATSAVFLLAQSGMVLAMQLKAYGDNTTYAAPAGTLALGKVNVVNAVVVSTSGANGVSTMTEYGVIVSGYLTVAGSKNSLQKTEHYGDRLINAYETAEYYFGDLGSAIIGADGSVIVSIDEIFMECVNVDIEYHVFTQIYSGNISSIDRRVGCFTAHGTPGTEFSWEIKAKRRGYEANRLEVFDEGYPIIYSNIENELDLQLENILLEA